ncbi:carbohydrate-binding module family 20 domain-containing protein [Sanguibacter massiliensis]|uniref:carbohydrate-binding module family 20 domain-containing protein n=1 Tax=Sanguibacter massiliensis TaxID=1973217 RepID=UPI000C845D55|nr:carbohydrate-binding module family 20 domain-containing protein [Sanguibacter massiliensis]
MHHPVHPPVSSRERRGRRLLAAAAAVAVAGAGLAAVVLPAQGATPRPTTSVTSPNGRGDVILNMFQWSWNDIARECTTTIGPAGYGYVQTSPPQEHIQGANWWTSYQPVSYKIESKLGTRAEYQNMINTCKTAGVGIIADAVVNHMTGADRGGGVGTGGSSYSIENYPGLYGSNDFNDCKEDIGKRYGDRYVVQNCRLGSLQDLRTSSEYVRGKIAGYFNDLISMGVAGFRIDAAKHIPAADLQAIKSKLSNPNVFWVHEVIGAYGEPIQPSEYLDSGDSHEFDYARDLKKHFDGQIKNLRTIGDGKLPSDRAGVFVDNHDTERNGETMNYKWGAKYLLANAFMLAWPYGSPSVYTGFQFTDKEAGVAGSTSSDVPSAKCSNSVWTCTHAKPEITGMVKFHNAVAGTSVTNWWDNGNNQVAFGRGDKGFLVLNNEASPATRTYKTSLPAGTYTDVVSATGKTYTVNGSGEFTATVPQYGALALVKGGATPTDPPTTTPPPTSGDLKVYYSTSKGWSAYKVHYKIGSGAWTTAPGADLTAACDGWVSRTIAGGASGITAAFNNGSGTWDNNGSKDYSLSGTVAAVNNGTVTSTDPCGTTTPTDPPTTPVTSAATFSVNATTVWGQNVYVVGSIEALGSWNAANAKPMSSATYPVWTSEVAIPAGTSFEYKFIKKDGNGNVIWESGANRTGMTSSSGSFSASVSWK